jgi:ribosome-binding protein aMBF1 (putative translation factor)
MGSRLKRQFDQQTRDAIINAAVVNRRKPIDPEQVQKGFGDRMREVRLRKGISQEALALICDVDRTYVGGVERGERNISLVNIYKIAQGLGIPAKELMP